MSQRFRYPPRIFWAVRGLPTFMVAIATLQTSLAWARVIITALAGYFGWKVGAFWGIAGDTLPMLMTAHLSLLLTLMLASVIGNLIGDVSISDEGVTLHLWSTTRFLRWEWIEGFYATTIGNPPRDLVFVRASKGLPFYTRLYGLLLGQGLVPGFFMVSDLQEFEAMVATFLEQVTAIHGEEGNRVGEGPPPPALALLGSPRTTLSAISTPLGTVDRTPSDEEVPPIRQAASLMIFTALALPFALALSNLMGLYMPWSALILFVLSVVEWPLASYGLVVLGDFFPGTITFPHALAVYPYTQVHRWVTGILLAFLMLIGTPALLLWLVVFASIAGSAYLLALLTAAVYRLPLEKAVAGAGISIVYQLFLYGLLIWNR
jgi:hypothetical protein